MKQFIQARWKAVMPLVAYAISEALAKGVPDLNTPSGIKAFISALVVAAMVYVKANVPTQPPA